MCVFLQYQMTDTAATHQDMHDVILMCAPFISCYIAFACIAHLASCKDLYQRYIPIRAHYSLSHAYKIYTLLFPWATFIWARTRDFLTWRIFVLITDSSSKLEKCALNAKSIRSNSNSNAQPSSNSKPRIKRKPRVLFSQVSRRISYKKRF